jgi:hypothetical protein
MFNKQTDRNKLTSLQCPGNVKGGGGVVPGVPGGRLQVLRGGVPNGRLLMLHGGIPGTLRRRPRHDKVIAWSDDSVPAA